VPPLVPRLLTASAVAAAVLGLALAAPACSSSGSSGRASSTLAPEDQLASDADVTAGLAQIETLNGQAVAALATDPAAAKQTVATIYDRWYAIEGTIKHHSTSTYLDLEDGLGSIKNGVDQNDVAKATTGAAAFSTAAATYLSQWPGTSVPTTPASP